MNRKIQYIEPIFRDNGSVLDEHLTITVTESYILRSRFAEYVRQKFPDATDAMIISEFIILNYAYYI